MKLTEDQHNELLRLLAELKSYIEAGYAAPTQIFQTIVNRINEILWDIVET